MSARDEINRHQSRPEFSSGTVAQIAPMRRSGAPLNHAVYDLLKERLLEGHYPAGTRLPTDDLRLELGVSKQPVMEALRRLSSDGLIEIVPQVGCLVTGYDLHEIEDFYLGFGGFEGSIAGTAALRRTDRQLTELDLISARIGALDGRHADHERIRAALHAGDDAAAREEMERHIVTTAAIIRDETAAERLSG